MDLAQYLIPAAAGLVSGAIGSLVAPWIQWGVESKREQKAGRKALLAEVRALLAEPPSLAEFRRMPIYSRVFPLVSEKTREVLAGEFDERGNEGIVLVLGGAHGGVNPYAHRVLADLATKEREWGLV
jgi:hypothetical protein